MVTGRLEEWSVDKNYSILWGYLYDDVNNRWSDGQWIHTSYVKDLHDLDLKSGDKVKTLNSTYLLGKKYNADT